MGGSVRFESRDEVGFVVIDNPPRRNALTVGMWEALGELVRGIDREGGHRCLVLCGAGEEAFASGADISEFEHERSDREQVTRYHERYVGPGLASLLECGIPTIAMIRGTCMGGGLEIASCCDIRIAADDAKLGIPISRMGFPLAFGETELLFRLFGRGIAAELLLEGRIYDAQEALSKGLVERVVPAERLEEEALATARRVAAGSPNAHRSTKAQFLRLLRDASPVTAEERAQSYDFADTEDYRIGYRAFLRKVKPVFEGR